jgi:antibiotic biosynthesis monooxygenase (ABM) superfamily enzyme
MSDLTGPFDTSKLPRIAPGSITVTIARTIKPGTEAQFLHWSEQMIHAVTHAQGCLGAVQLRPGLDSDEYHMVFRFVDALHLRRWERSDEREALLLQGDEFIESERVTVTPGGDEFFAVQGTQGAFKNKLIGFFVDLVWVYPVSIAIAVLLSPYLATLPIWGRVIVTTATFALSTRFAMRPLRKRLEQRRMLPSGVQTK